MKIQFTEIAIFQRVNGYFISVTVFDIVVEST